MISEGVIIHLGLESASVGNTLLDLQNSSYPTKAQLYEMIIANSVLHSSLAIYLPFHI